ncbi:ATP-grasp domain-containing protein [Bacillus sp. BP-3]|uniref:ATP-grasp domain-containing protein n=1 Tax=Bacillus sp. BP-3 TaxID=3022773 RepID=UPI00232D4724|nr:ATP-grasp domain-containing protein [Bacillus sp. BP-3]MDC2865513.1 ATP-grasp domain-containing protein [Bacillus sp. BP-3]
MKKLLFIESNTTGTGMLALIKARELGFTPVLFTSSPKRYIGLEETQCIILECDTNNLDCIRAIIRSQFEADEIKGITTTSEFYIETVAVLAKELGLVGNPIDTVKKCRNKAEMRLLLKDMCNIYPLWFYTIGSPERLEEIKDNIRFPCIVKPVDDSGSNNVLKCYSYEEVRNQTEKILNNMYNVRSQKNIQNVLVEEYVPGQEYSVEVFAHNGKFHIVGVTQKIVGYEPYFIEGGHTFPAQVSDDIRLVIERGVTAIIEKINWQNGPCHLEIKVREEKVFLVEFNGRLAGGMIPELIRYATGVDLLKEQLKVVTGIAPEVYQNPFLYAGIRFIIPPRDGIIKSIVGIEEIENTLGIKEVKFRAILGESVQKVQNAYGRIGHIIGISPNVDELNFLLDKCMNALKIEVEGCGECD